MTDDMASPRRELRYAGVDEVSLDMNSLHTFAQDHALSIYRSHAVYSFIPKNACSTLRFSIARDNGCISSEQQIDWLRNNNATFRATLPELARAKYTFVVLRCPYRRMVSLFLDKIAGKADNRLKMLSGSSLRRIYRSRESDRKKITFRRFLEMLSRSDVIDLDHHWVPQFRFLVYSVYDDVFCVEAMDTLAERLRDRIGLELCDARQMTKHGTSDLQKVNIGTCADMPATEIDTLRSEGRVPNYANFFDSQTREICERLYGADIALFISHFGDSSLLFKR